MEEPFAPSLFVEIRKRMGEEVFDVFQGAIIAALDNAKAKQTRRPPSRPAMDEHESKDDDDPGSILQATL
jgi:hypothetical protein